MSSGCGPFSVIIAAVVCFLGKEIHATNLPLLQLKGDIRVAVLFDFHRSIEQNGTCTYLDTEAIQIGQAIVWTYEQMKTSNSPGVLGAISLEVYDTCGSPKLALEILSRMITKASPPNPQRFAGVISYTGNAVGREIDEYLRLMGYLHVRISGPKDVVIVDSFKTTLQIPVASVSRAQALTAMVKSVNWTYVSTVALNDHRSNADRNIFADVASRHGLCIASSITVNDVNDIIMQYPTKGVIVFGQEELANSTWFANSSNAGESFYIFSGFSDTFREVTPRSDTISGNITDWRSPRIFALLDNLQNGEALLNDYLSATDANSSGLEYLKAVHGCASNPPSPSCALLDHYFNNDVSYGEVRRGRDAFLTMFEAARQLQNGGCSDFRFHACVVWNTLADLRHSSADGMEPIRYSSGKFCEADHSLPLAAIADESSFTEIGLFRNGRVQPLNNTNSLDLTNMFPASQCEGHCPECKPCNIPKDGHMKAATLNGTIYLGGVFPMHTASIKKISTEGLIAAEAFIWACKTAKLRHPNLLPNIDIGAFAVDSFGNSIKSNLIISDFEECVMGPENPMKNIPITRKNTFGYVEVLSDNRFSAGNKMAAPNKPIVTISDLGMYSRRFFIGNTLLDRIIALLKALDWTYPILIWSESIGDESFRIWFERSLRSRKICLAGRFTISKEDADMDVHRIAHALTETPASSRAVLLLTDEVSTHSLLTELSESRTNSTAFDFVFFPWNAKVPSMITNDIILGSLILDTTASSVPDFYDHLSSLSNRNTNEKPWWKKFHAEQFNCRESCYQTRHALNSTICVTGQFEFDQSEERFSSYVIAATDTLLHALDNAVTKQCGDLLTECNFNALVQEQNLNLGEISFPLDIKNVQRSDKDEMGMKTIGAFDISGQISLDVALVFSYDAHGQTVVALSECVGWCPMCFHCPDALPSRDQYHYIPGDVIIVGVAPVHSSGNRPFSCGTFDPRGYVDAEAFQFAVRTAKDRYANLLPNVTVGSLVLDSCQDIERTIQFIANFESCKETYGSGSEGFWAANPKNVIGYFSVDNATVAYPLAEALGRLQRPVVSPTPLTGIDQKYETALSTAESNDNIVEAVSALLAKYNWTYISVIYSADFEHQQHVNVFQKLATDNNVCIAGVYMIDSSTASAYVALDALHKNRENNVVVTFLNLDNSTSLFRLVNSRRLRKVWINVGGQDEWVASLPEVAFGSFFVERPKESNEMFEEYYSKLNQSNPSSLPWFGTFSTYASALSKSRDAGARNQAAKLIGSVDTLLHGFHDFYLQTCPKGDGMCSQIGNMETPDFSQGILTATRKVSFVSDSGRVLSIQKTNCFAAGGNYSIKTYQKHENNTQGYVQAGYWDGKIRFVSNFQMKFYDAFGYVKSYDVTFGCTGTCNCVNIKIPEENTGKKTKQSSETGRLFYETSGVFIGSVWAIVVVTIAGVGAFIAIILMCYIMWKLCTHSLAGKNVDLGLLLLFADIMLFMSVLPFTFSPSAAGCGLRYLLTGLAYALCFSVCLIKAMNIHEYSSVGLGGDVSRLNNFIFVFFILGVQVAIGVQFWVLSNGGSTLLTEAGLDGNVLYACSFSKSSFVSYMSYVMFLLLLSTLYSFAVRNERRNMSEARLLLSSSLSCVAVWITWIVVLFVMGPDFIEPTICVGIVSCATIVLVVLFLPKIHRLARPKKYDLKRGQMIKGSFYKSDDMGFEGPYSQGGIKKTDKKYANNIVGLSSDFFY